MNLRSFSFLLPAQSTAELTARCCKEIPFKPRSPIVYVIFILKEERLLSFTFYNRTFYLTQLSFCCFLKKFPCEFCLYVSHFYIAFMRVKVYLDIDRSCFSSNWCRVSGVKQTICRQSLCILSASSRLTTKWFQNIICLQHYFYITIFSCT